MCGRVAHVVEPGRGRPGFVGVSQTGPTLSWSASDASAASNCSGE